MVYQPVLQTNSLSEAHSTLADYSETGLRLASINNRQEVPSIRYFSHFMDVHVPPISVTYRNGINWDIRARSRMIHARPFCFFDGNGPCGKQKVELGDLLFVVKWVRNGQLTDHRISHSQAKISSPHPWHVPSHQFEFLRNIGNWTFRFARNQDGAIRTWNLQSRSPWLTHFLLLHSALNLAIPPRRLDHLCQQPCDHVHAGCCLLSHRKRSNYIEHCPQWSFGRFISRFLASRGRGARVQPGSNLEQFLAALYRLVGWHMDPPEEFEGFIDEGEEYGYAIVEYTFRQQGDE